MVRGLHLPQDNCEWNLTQNRKIFLKRGGILCDSFICNLTAQFMNAKFVDSNIMLQCQKMKIPLHPKVILSICVHPSPPQGNGLKDLSLEFWSVLSRPLQSLGLSYFSISLSLYTNVAFSVSCTSHCLVIL